MPKTTIPLVGPPTRRPHISTTTTDQIFGACLIDPIPDDLKQSAIIYAEKRVGALAGSTVASGKIGRFAHSVINTGSTPSFAAPISVFMDSAAASAFYVYASTTLIGSVDSTNTSYFCGAIDIIRNDVTNCVFLDSQPSTSALYYVPIDYAIQSGSLTFTADTASGTPTLSNVSGTTPAGIYVGQALSGTGIPAGARVLTRSPDTVTPTTITMTANATATNNTVTITREGVAKVIDSDFPLTACGEVAELDGYLFVMTSDGKIYNSDLNSITSWSASNYISCDRQTDTGLGVIAYADYIVGFGSNSIEFFRNAGNPSGSPLSRVDELTIVGLGGRSITTNSTRLVMQGRLYFIGSDRNLYVMDGMKPRRLNHEGLFGRQLSAPSCLTMSSHSGRYVLIISALSASAISYIYDPSSGQFSRLDSSLALIGNNYGPPTTQMVDYEGTSGKLFNFSSSTTYQDNASSFTMTIQTIPYALNNGAPFTVKSVELLADNQSSGSTTLATSGDDYATFTTRGTFDLTASRKTIRRCGYYRNHAIFKLTDSGNQPWRGQAIVVDWEPRSP